MAKDGTSNTGSGSCSISEHLDRLNLSSCLECNDDGKELRTMILRIRVSESQLRKIRIARSLYPDFSAAVAGLLAREVDRMLDEPGVVRVSEE